jgi:hypothetical protein
VAIKNTKAIAAKWMESARFKVTFIVSDPLGCVVSILANCPSTGAQKRRHQVSTDFQGFESTVTSMTA